MRGNAPRSHRPRCVGPQRAEEFSLRAHVDLTDARSIPLPPEHRGHSTKWFRKRFLTLGSEPEVSRENTRFP
jgi:hypothetical protein